MNLAQDDARRLRRLGTLPLVSGILAVIFAAVALLWPGGTVTSVVVVVSIYLLANGIGTVIAGLRLRPRPGSGPLLALGIICSLLALVLLWHPGMGTRLLVGFMGASLVFFGLFVVGISVLLRAVTSRWGWALPAGIVAAVLGMIFWARPDFGAETLGVLLGIGVLLVGVALIAAGIQLRRFGRHAAARLGETPGAGVNGPHTSDRPHASDQDVVIEGTVIDDPDDEPTGNPGRTPLSGP
jgi:uncharacterized membrane protein HdeD (DUF308 family)